MTHFPIEQWPPELITQAYLEHPDGRRLVPTQAVADLFGCGASNLREMRRIGKLAATVWRQGNAHYYDLADVADAYLERFPLKVRRPEIEAADAEAEAKLAEAPFLRRREAGPDKAASGATETASENAQEQRQTGENERQGEGTKMETGLALVLAEEELKEEQRGELQAAFLAMQGTVAEQATAITTQAHTIVSLAQTIEAQRGEIERLTRAVQAASEVQQLMSEKRQAEAEKASEGRQDGWWYRLWKKRTR